MFHPEGIFTRRWRVVFCAALAAGATGWAHAGTVSFQLINRTNLSFDYSLQLANVRGAYNSNPSFVGKSTLHELSRDPSIGPGQASPMQSYRVAQDYWSDGVSFNMLARDGTPYGLRDSLSFHTCDIPSAAEGVNVQFMLVDRGTPQEPKLVLVEYTPDGDTCEFHLGDGFGSPSWGPVHP